MLAEEVAQKVRVRDISALLHFADGTAISYPVKGAWQIYMTEGSHAGLPIHGDEMLLKMLRTQSHFEIHGEIRRTIDVVRATWDLAGERSWGEQ